MASKGFKIDKYDDEDEDEIEEELQMKEETFDTEDLEEFDHQLPEEQFVPKMSKKQKKKLKKQGFIISSSSEDESEAENEIPTPENPENEDIAEGAEDQEEIHIVQAEVEIPEVKEEEPVEIKKLSAKEKRRLREKERQKEAEERKAAMKAADVECKICKNEFETRNALFKHIKEVNVL